MVVKTGYCSFSELRIYPGHGTQYVRRDGRSVTFIDGKAAALYKQGKKAARLTWTQAWRRNNKKVRVEVVQKRARKRRVRLQKPIQGLSLEDLRRKRAQKPEYRKAQRDAATKEVKDRKKKTTKSVTSKLANRSQPKMKVSKKGMR